MTVYTELCELPLLPGEGKPMLGIPGYETFRFAVQVAIVSPENRLPFVLGSSQLGGPRWRDLTGDVQGLSWTRGGEPAQRAIAGELTFRLNNPYGEWCPWMDEWYGPGAMCRVVVSDGVVIHPQFCGTIQSWDEASEGLFAYQWVDVVAWEQLFILAGVNDHALAGVVGGGDTLTQRIDRLLDQADWPFGRLIDSTTTATYQATDFASDVATGVYLTVDSVDATVYPGRDGMLIIHDRATGSGVHWFVAHTTENPDSIVTKNDDQRILSSVDLARVGGSVVHYDNTGIAGRYQRRTTQRVDLITVAEPGDADLQRVADGMLARARCTYRPVSFEVQSGQGAAAAKLIVEADLTDRVTIPYGWVVE